MYISYTIPHSIYESFAYTIYTTLDNQAPLESFLVRLDQLEGLVGASFFPTTLPDPAARRKLDDAVPTYRDLTIALDPVASAYAALLPPSNKTNGSGGSSGKGKGVRGSMKPGVVHLCAVIDCSRTVSQLLCTSSK